MLYRQVKDNISKEGCCNGMGTWVGARILQRRAKFRPHLKPAKSGWIHRDAGGAPAASSPMRSAHSSVHSSPSAGSGKGGGNVPRAARWDSCARAASGSVSRELFDAAVQDSQKSLTGRAAHAQWPTRLEELFDAVASGSRKLPEQSPAGRPDRPSSSPGALRESLTAGRTDRLRTVGRGSENAGPMAPEA